MTFSVTRSIGRSSGGTKKIRRRYLIDTPFQLALAGNMLLIVAVAMAAAVLMTSWVLVYVMQERLSGAIDVAYWMKLGIIFLFILAGIAIWTVRASHALAGPVYKTRLILQNAAKGKLPDRPVQFRRGDAFRALAADLNGCLDAMRARHPSGPQEIGPSDSSLPT